MSQISRVPVPLVLSGAAPAQVAAFARDAAKVLGQPPLRCVTTPGAAAGSSIAYTIQVTNSARNPCTGYFMLDVFVATTPGGIAQDGQTAVWGRGTVQQTILENAWWRVMTTSDGTASVTLSGGSGQRIIHASASNPHDPSSPGVLT